MKFGVSITPPLVHKEEEKIVVVHGKEANFLKLQEFALAIDMSEPWCNIEDAIKEVAAPWSQSTLAKISLLRTPLLLRSKIGFSVFKLLLFSAKI